MTRRPVPVPDAKPIAKPKLDVLIAEAKANPAATHTLRCRTVVQGRFTQLNYIRHLPARPVAESEPEGLLTKDIAPNPSEALLAAFGFCLARLIRRDGAGAVASVA